MPAHYVLSYGAVRPYNPTIYGVATEYVTKRWKESTTPIAVSYNFVLPFLNCFNRKLELTIKEIEANGDDAKEDLPGAALDSLKVAALKFGEFGCRVGCQTSLIVLLIRHDSHLSRSTAFAFDMYQGLHFEYFGRLFNALYLPKKWAMLLGAAPKAGELENFEHRPLGITAAAEDIAKRHTVQLATDLIAGTAFAVLTSELITEHEEGEKPQPAEVAKEYVKSTFVRYAGAFVGAIVGSQISGQAEYFGEIIGAVAATSVLAARLKAAKAAKALR